LITLNPLKNLLSRILFLAAIIGVALPEDRSWEYYTRRWAFIFFFFLFIWWGLGEGNKNHSFEEEEPLLFVFVLHHSLILPYMFNLVALSSLL